MKTIKRLTAGLTALAIAAGSQTVPLGSFFTSTIVAYGLSEYSAEKPSDTVWIDPSATDLGSFPDAAQEVREHIKAHDENFSVIVEFDSIPDDPYGDFNDIISGALAHTGEPGEGDWLRFHIYTLSSSWTLSSRGGKDVKMTCDFGIVYNADAEQMIQAEKKAGDIIKYLALEGKTDREKIHEIYDHICHTVSYDYDRLEDDSTQIEHSAYAALCEGKAVCQGYALAIYELMLKAGVDCRIVSGKLSGGNHAWNIVKLDGKYYYLDSTNDTYNDPYELFLVSGDELDDYALDAEYSYPEFKAEYPMSATPDSGDKAKIVRDASDFSYTSSAEGVTIQAYLGTDKKVVIPDTINGIPVTELAYGIFEDNQAIEEVHLPDTVKSINYWAFNNCYNLKKINIPKDCELIGQFAFQNTAIEQILIPKEFTGSIVAGFAQGTNIHFTVEEGNERYSVENGCLIDHNCLVPMDYAGEFGGNAVGVLYFNKDTRPTSCTVPKDVTIIGEYAFQNADTLRGIVLPEGLLAVEYSAFEGCSKLMGIEIPDSVKNIDSTALFSHCTSLISVKLPENAVYHGGDSSEPGTIDRMFYECNALKNVNIPKSITTIGDFSFTECQNLETITLPEGLKVIGEDAFAGCKRLRDVTIPEGVTTLGWQAFSGCESLKKIVIPDEVSSIGPQAFAACVGLTSVTLPYDIKVIPEEAFFACNELTEIVLPDGLETIGENAFAWSLKLKSVSIPNTVTRIENTAFNGCSALKDVYYSGTREEWNKISIGTDNEYLKNANIHFGASIGSGFRIFFTDGSSSDTAGLTLTFIGTDGARYTGTVTDGSFEADLPEGKTYTVLCEKEGFAPREYEGVKVASSGRLKVELRRYGDIDGSGSIQAKDVTAISAHVKSMKMLSGYDLSVADVNRDGDVGTKDVAALSAHVKGIKLIA